MSARMVAEAAEVAGSQAGQSQAAGTAAMGRILAVGDIRAARRSLADRTLVDRMAVGGELEVGHMVVVGRVVGMAGHMVAGVVRVPRL